MKYCNKCHSEINENAKYCDVCGEKINKESEQHFSPIVFFIYGIGFVFLLPFIIVFKVLLDLDVNDISLNYFLEKPFIGIIFLLFIICLIGIIIAIVSNHKK